MFRFRTNRHHILALLFMVMAVGSALAQSEPRARDLGIPFDGTPGALNAITDVGGVEVGFTDSPCCGRADDEASDNAEKREDDCLEEEHGQDVVLRASEGFHESEVAATLEHGLACAWREELASSGAPAWEPRWGGPENLMDLAYLFSHAPKPDRGVALAYARGAVTAVPEWHYVRDVLLPR